MELGSAVILVIVSCCICYQLVRRKWEKRSRCEKFKGQVAGICAGLALFGVCTDYSAEQIYRHAMKEYERCRQIDRNRPDPASDPIYYASHSDFPEFTLLCAIQYAEGKGADTIDAAAILEYCQAKLVHSHKLTAHIPSPWK